MTSHHASHRHHASKQPDYISSKFYNIAEVVSKLILLGIAVGFFVGFEPYERSIAWVEYQRHKPVAEESVPVWLAMTINVLIGVFWMVTVVAVNIYLQRQHGAFKKGIVPRIVKAFLSLFNSLLVTWAIVEPLKRFAAEPRPHFLARCYGTIDLIPALEEIPNLITNDMCWANQEPAGNPYKFKDRADFDGFMEEDRLSFPSAHSALTSSIFIWMGFYFWWLASQVNIPGARTVGTTIMVLMIAPTLYIAASRVRDQWHYTWDVFSGLLIGSFCAYWQFKTYYPSNSKTQDIFEIMEDQINHKK